MGVDRPQVWQAGLAVRRDWPDRTHEFVRFCLDSREAGWFIESDRAYWRRSHFRPRHTVVRISPRDFELHFERRLCRAPDCPDVLDSTAIVDDAAAAR